MLSERNSLYRPATKKKVMLLVVSVLRSVILSTRGGGSDHHSWCIGTHHTDTPSVQVPVPPASDIWWPRLETCSNLFTWGTPILVLISGAIEAYSKRSARTLLECFLFCKYKYQVLIAIIFLFSVCSEGRINIPHKNKMEINVWIHLKFDISWIRNLFQLSYRKVEPR